MELVVLTYRIFYAICGTDLAYAATRFDVTDVVCQVGSAISLRACYAMTRTEPMHSTKDARSTALFIRVLAPDILLR
eukprot:3941737-Rhodomonas_salina.4